MLKENVSLEGKTVLVTGAAGFIGANLVRRLLSEVKDIRVVGIDSITDYYDVNIKYERLREIEALAAGGTRPDGAAAPGCCCTAADRADAAGWGCCCDGADAAGAASECAEVSAAGAAACFGAASFSEESPRIWKESTAALIESSASSLFTEASTL